MTGVVWHAGVYLLGTSEAVAVHGRRAVKVGAGRRATSAASGVRRDVCGANEAVAVAVAVLLGSVLGLAEREVVHVELVGHGCDVVELYLRYVVCVVMDKIDDDGCRRGRVWWIIDKRVG